MRFSRVTRVLPVDRDRPRLSYANVTSTLALVIALSMGGAYAHGKIGSALIKDNAVKSRHIAGKAVKTSDLAGGAVATNKIKGSAVTGGKVKNGSLSGSDLAPRATGTLQAAVHVEQSGIVLRSFNRLGGEVSATRTGAGRYTVTIPGAQGAWSEKIVGVSTSSLIGECKTWIGTGAEVEVVCTRSDKTEWTYQDALFSLWLIK